MDSKTVPKHFVSFVVTLEQHGGDVGVYQSRLVDSPVGGRPTLAIDLRRLDLDDPEGDATTWRNSIGLKLPGGARHLRGEAFETLDLRQAGELLFRSVFVGSLAEAFRASAERARGEGLGLRICLLLDSVPELADLPWEALWDPSSGAFLADQPHLLVVRTLSVEGRDARPMPPPFRLLGLLPQPAGEIPLSGLDEWGEIGQHLHPLIDRGVLRHGRVSPPSLAALGRRFDAGPCHVLHVVAHGRLGGAGEGGVVGLEDGTGRVDEVTGGELARALERHRDLRLVVLNVCFGGHGPADDPFDGLAQTLLRRGVPAVVAMRGEISDAAAVTFASALYRKLAGGHTVEAAMVEARRALALGKHRAEWATPVLYLRGENVRLFPEPLGADLDPGEVSGGTPPEVTTRHRTRSGAVAVLLLVVAGLAALWGYQNAVRLDDTRPDATYSDGGLANDTAPRVNRLATLLGVGTPPNACPSPPGLRDIHFIRIEPGEVDLGTRILEITRPFCIANAEVSRRDWSQIMGGRLPLPELAGDLPMFRVTHTEARRFTEMLERRELGVTYRLPTADEWEYAGRAGSTADYHYGHGAVDLHRYGNCENSWADDGYDRAAPLGSFEPNAWGLFDIHGNVSEWVEAEHPDKPGKVLHLGGSYDHVPANCAFDARRWVQGSALYYTGFRVVRDLD